MGWGTVLVNLASNTHWMPHKLTDLQLGCKELPTDRDNNCLEHHMVRHNPKPRVLLTK
jgi:hypothetical protein